jgi:hypothetical protein
LSCSIPADINSYRQNEFEVSANSSEDDNEQDDVFLLADEGSDKTAGESEDGNDGMTEDEEDVVFVNETKNRQAKVAAGRAAATKGRGKGKKGSPSTVTPKLKKKKAKAIPNSAATITPARKGRPAKEKSIFLSTPAGTPMPTTARRLLFWEYPHPL